MAAARKSAKTKTAGADTIEHMVFSDDETIGMIREAGVPVTPTLSHRTDHAIQLRREVGTAEFVLKKMKYLQPFCFDTFQKMYKAGVKIAMGTDMGFEPHMGTNAAEAIKLGDELGTLEAGKLADVIAVNGDPLQDIACLQDKKKMVLVMKEGRIYADRRPGRSKSVVNVQPGEWKIVDYL